MNDVKRHAGQSHVQSASGIVASAKAEIREVLPEQVEDLLEAGAVLLDVREHDELVRDGMIPGSLHAPRGLLEWCVDPQSSTFITALHPERPVILYCRSGNRSALAAQVMEKMGYGDVTSLQGGLVRWKTEGRPVAAPQAIL
jgi:rhodanese-related sulfurtransferase